MIRTSSTKILSKYKVKKRKNTNTNAHLDENFNFVDNVVETSKRKKCSWMFPLEIEEQIFMLLDPLFLIRNVSRVCWGWRYIICNNLAFWTRKLGCKITNISQIQILQWGNNIKRFMLAIYRCQELSKSKTNDMQTLSPIYPNVYNSTVVHVEHARCNGHWVAHTCIKNWKTVHEYPQIKGFILFVGSTQVSLPVKWAGFTIKKKISRIEFISIEKSNNIGYDAHEDLISNIINSVSKSDQDVWVLVLGKKNVKTYKGPAITVNQLIMTDKSLLKMKDVCSSLINIH